MTAPCTMRRLALTVAAALLPFAFAGCQTAMSTPLPDPAATSASGSVKPNEFPLRFKAHSFGQACFNASECFIRYAGSVLREDPPGKVNPPPSAGYQEKLSGYVLGIANFPEPAAVRWRSLDGSAHDANVDIGEIFRDELVIHHVAPYEIPEGWAHDIKPAIVLEVNDRTINVYMVSEIATKAEQIPGNKYSHNKRELTKVWSRTY